MNVFEERLLSLADFIEKLPPNQYRFETLWKNETECGSVGCALGWASRVPLLRNIGVRGEMRRVEGRIVFMIRPKNGYKYMMPDTAAMKMFGLSQDECEDLFFGPLYVYVSVNNTWLRTVDDVLAKVQAGFPGSMAERLRQFVKWRMFRANYCGEAWT